MKWIPAQCERGDMIRVKLGSIYHYGIFVTEENVIAFGLPPLPEYRKTGEEIQVISTSIDIFSCNQIVERAVFNRAERRKMYSREKTISLASARIGEGGYNLIHNNCEHFVYECVFGVSRSTIEDEMRARYRQRPVFDFYISEITEEMSEKDITPGKRKKEIDACSDQQLKRKKVSDWKLLEKAADASFGLAFSDLRFRKRLWGKWTNDQFFFSLAAGSRFVAAAVSNAAVGIDLEDESHFQHSGKAFAFAQSLRSDTSTQEAMVEYSRRQAVFKCSGKGLFKPMRMYNAPQDCISFTVSEIPGHVFSASGTHCRSIRVFLYNDGMLNRIKPKIL